jgi:glutaconyl-CoA/methylmalonyl-CoA decarboxylase subunit gamma
MRRYTLEIRGREFVIDVEEEAADRFAVTVGGESYVVSLTGDEDLPEATIAPALATGQSAGTAASVPAAAIAPRESRPPPRAAAPAPRKPAGAGGAGALTAPMPGVILDVGVKVGDTVDRGQVVAVLEAMKMQNSIKSPRAGTIAEVCVTVGQAVGHGDTIIRFQEG